MRSALKLLPLLIFTAVIGFRLGEGADGEISVESAAEAAAPAFNACGCYRDAAGACYCGKRGGKCVCPGECEPQGCEEKRAKEIQKEVDAEAKRAREAEKKQEDEQAARAEKERQAAEAADEDDDDTDTATADAPDKKQETAKAGKDDDDDSDKAPRKKFKKTKGAKLAKAKASEG